MGKVTPGFSNNLNPSTSVLSSYVKKINDNLQRFPLLSFQIIEDVELTTTAKNVFHNLKRVPQGYLVIRSNAAQTVFDNGLSSVALSLAAGGTVTVTLFVF